MSLMLSRNDLEEIAALLDYLNIAMCELSFEVTVSDPDGEVVGLITTGDDGYGLKTRG